METCPPIIWPEQPAPPEVQSCDECGLIEHGTRIIWGEGNPDAPVWAILDNPGARENRQGEPFVCGTRETLQKTAARAGLDLKQDLFVTYVLKRRPIRAYDKPRTRQICLNHLLKQIQAHDPQLAICLGNVATQAFFDDSDAAVKDLRGSWSDIRGIPTTVSYHPLAVRRRPNLKRYFEEDWERVAKAYLNIVASIK